MYYVMDDQRCRQEIMLSEMGENWDDCKYCDHFHLQEYGIDGGVCRLCVLPLLDGYHQDDTRVARVSPIMTGSVLAGFLYWKL